MDIKTCDHNPVYATGTYGWAVVANGVLYSMGGKMRGKNAKAFVENPYKWIFISFFFAALLHFSTSFRTLFLNFHFTLTVV